MSALSKNAAIGVIGAGTMGAGIAQVAAQAGHEVLLFDAVDGAAEKGKERTAKALKRVVEKGKMEQADVEALLGRIRPVGALKDIAPASLVIEAIVEDLDVKQKVFGELEDICGNDVILCTNTSSLSLTAIAKPLKRPERLAGMHFFNPPPLMALVEVIRSQFSAEEVLKTVYETAAAWGKSPVYASSTPGFIVNSVARPFYAEALRILEEGAADVPTIDTVLREAGGFRMGPFQLMDLIGHDVNYEVTRSVWEANYYDPRYLPSLVQKELVDGGLLGRKTGRGFYDYGEDADNPEAAAHPKGSAPASVTAIGDLGCSEPLVARMEDAGIKVERKKSEDIFEQGMILVGEAILRRTNGMMATELADILETRHGPNLILYDLALDYASAERIALAKADQASDQALNGTAGLFQALGMTVSVIDDVPGLIVARTVAMLANEGTNAVLKGVASAGDVDTAMMKGVNYPRGPLAWAEEIGLDEVLEVLYNLAQVYGEDRYRASSLLQRKVAADGSFHG